MHTPPATSAPQWKVHNGQKVVGLFVAFTIFSLAASISRPRNSAAQDAPAGPAPLSVSHPEEPRGVRPTPSDGHGNPLLGEMIGADYRVWVYGGADGPLYTVCDLNGKALQADLPADEVYRAFPSLDISTMTLEPIAPRSPLMLAEPATGTEQ